MKATLSNLRQSPRKVRLVANLVKGKPAALALAQLALLPKRAARPVAKLLESAVANARATGADESKLVVASVRVDGARTLRRHRPRARGSAARINKRQSHITVSLGVKQ